MRTPLRRLPHSDLHYHAYKLDIVQELPDCNFYSRSAFCEQFVTLVKEYTLFFYYFVDRASRYKFLLITNLTHVFMYLFISSLYMFRASQCSSSGDRIVLIHHLV